MTYSIGLILFQIYANFPIYEDASISLWNFELNSYFDLHKELAKFLKFIDQFPKMSYFEILPAYCLPFFQVWRCHGERALSSQPNQVVFSNSHWNVSITWYSTWKWSMWIKQRAFQETVLSFLVDRLILVFFSADSFIETHYFEWCVVSGLLMCINILLNVLKWAGTRPNCCGTISSILSNLSKLGFLIAKWSFKI